MRILLMGRRNRERCVNMKPGKTKCSIERPTSRHCVQLVSPTHTPPQPSPHTTTTTHHNHTPTTHHNHTPTITHRHNHHRTHTTTTPPPHTHTTTTPPPHTTTTITHQHHHHTPPPPRTHHHHHTPPPHTTTHRHHTPPQTTTTHHLNHHHTPAPPRTTTLHKNVYNATWVHIASFWKETVLFYMLLGAALIIILTIPPPNEVGGGRYIIYIMFVHLSVCLCVPLWIAWFLEHFRLLNGISNISYAHAPCHCLEACWFSWLKVQFWGFSMTFLHPNTDFGQGLLIS